MQIHHLRYIDAYITIIVVICISVSFLNIPAYVYSIKPSILPGYFFYILFGLGLPVLIFRQEIFTHGRVTPFIWWCFAYLGLTVIHLITLEDESLFQIMKLRTQYAGLLLFFGIFLHYYGRIGSWQKVLPIIVIVVASSIILEFFIPKLINNAGAVPGRAGSFYFNANDAAAAMLLSLLVSIPALSVKQRPIFLMLSLMAVMVTFSRSGLLIWVVITLFGSMLHIFPRATMVLPGLAVVILLSVAPFLEDTIIPALGYEAGKKNLLNRIDSIINADFSDASASDRKQGLTDAIHVFMNDPFSGGGIGASEAQIGGAGPHNQTAFMAAEYGIIGVILWFWLIVIVLQGGYFRQRSVQYLCGAIVIMLSLFSHNLLDHPFWLVTFVILTLNDPLVSVADPNR
jgi:hypothetical protein